MQGRLLSREFVEFSLTGLRLSGCLERGFCMDAVFFKPPNSFQTPMFTLEIPPTTSKRCFHFHWKQRHKPFQDAC